MYTGATYYFFFNLIFLHFLAALGFIAARGLSLAVASRGYSLLQAQAPGHTGFSGCGAGS